MANRQPLGSLPVVVISSGPIASETERASRDNAGARLDFLSSNSLHIEATGGGHEIHLFQPARVIEGITRAVSAVRTRAPLRPISDNSARPYDTARSDIAPPRNLSKTSASCAAVTGLVGEMSCA